MICRIHRWNISRCRDEGAAIARSTARHVARCRRCAQYLRDLENLEQRLREDAHAIEIAAVPLKVIPRPQTRRASRIARWGVPAFATAAAAAVLVMVVNLGTLVPTDHSVRQTPLAHSSAVSGPLAVPNWLDVQAQDAYMKEAQLLAQHALGAVGHIVSRVTLPDPAMPGQETSFN